MYNPASAVSKQQEYVSSEYYLLILFDLLCMRSYVESFQRQCHCIRESVSVIKSTEKSKKSMS